jgi:alpha-tubulin suppressor-like RCC1 family protein
MVSGSNSVIALKSDGTVYDWGLNSSGELGDGTSMDRAAPFHVGGVANAISVRTADGTSAAILTDGTVFWWGASYDSNVDVSSTPVLAPNLKNVVDVALDIGFISLLADGTVVSGLDAAPVAGLTDITAIRAGGGFTLALKADGTVWAWGYNYYGALGNGTTNTVLTPAQIAGLSGIVAIAAGDSHALALKNDGSVWAWGWNISGQLGDGTTTNRLTPVQVQGVSNATALAAGSYHSVAIKSDGTVWQWGQTAVAGGEQAPPTPVPGISNAISIAAGANGFTAVIKSDGTIWTLGDDNRYGVFGDGSFGGDTTTIHQVVSLNLLGGGVANAPPSAVFTLDSQGTGNTFLADASNSSDSDGTVVAYAWSTSNGQTATGKTATLTFNPQGSYTITLSVTDNQGSTAQSSASVTVPQLSVKPVVAAGMGDVLAIRADGTLYSWGNNNTGQLGSGKGDFTSVPGLVALLGGVKAVAGSGFTLALKQDGTVWAWGDDIFGELGNGTSGGRSEVPVMVKNLTGVTAIAAGSSSGLAVKADGSVWGWGNLGGAGNPVPTQVSGISDAVAVAAGDSSSFALKNDGTVWAWGLNEYGEFGTGVATPYTGALSGPVQVPGLKNVVAIAAGGASGLAIESDGSLWIWGDNQAGTLGIGATAAVVPPTRVPGLNQVVAVAASGSDGTTVLQADGTVYEFGVNPYFHIQNLSQRAGLQSIIAIAPGVALSSSGLVYAWGDNVTGALGNGTFAANSGNVLVHSPDGGSFLDLIPGAAKTIPADQIPPFFSVAVSSGTLGTSTVNLSNTTLFNAADIGKTGSVFVTALVPPGTLGSTTGTITARDMSSVSGSAITGTGAAVQVQLTPAGWQPLVSGQLTAYATGVLGTALSAQTILNNVDTTTLAGAQICVGYGTSAQEMASAGRIATVATVPGGAGNGSCPGAGGIFPQSGYWYNPAESGRGFTIEFNGTKIFMAAFLYDSSGRSTWYGAGPTAMTGSTFSAPLTAYSGGQTLTGNYQAPTQGTSPGNISITFTDATDGMLTWPGGTIPITRFPFVPNGLSSPPSATQPQTGWWFNPAESGRGYSIEIQNNTAFIAAYMYDSFGNPVWYDSGPAALTANDTYIGNWSSLTGGQTLTGSYHPPNSPTNAGNLTIQFTSTSAGTLTLPNGNQIPIQRFGF